MRGDAIRASKSKQGHWSCVEHYEPNGCNPEDHHHGNDDPGEYAQPRTHAVARAVLPVPGLNQPWVLLTIGHF